MIHIGGDSSTVSLNSDKNRNKSRKEHQARKENMRNYSQQHASELASKRTENRQTQTDSAYHEISTHMTVIERLTKIYMDSISELPTHTCETCDKLVYPSKSHNFKVTNKVREKFATLGHCIEIGAVLHVCERCRNNMLRGSMSPQVKYNNLSLPPVPREIECLTPAEIRLVSQVKLFMKVFLLCGGRGQPAVKGLAIHFPLKVNEVIEQLQLPNSLSDSDLVVVAEDFAGIDKVTELQVCTNKVYDALVWLKTHNPLYANIQITPKEDIDKSVLEDVSRITIQQFHPQIEPQQQVAFGIYTEISPGISILRASTHQGNPMYSPNCGTQCTAMSAAFLAFTFIESPLTWTTATLDQVMICGNKFYTKKLPAAGHQYLNTDDVSGVIPNVFQSQDINLEIVMSALPDYQGHLNKLSGKYMRLKGKLQQFIESEHQFAIFTSSNYSMGIYKDLEHLYFFDSHCRGSKGGTAQRGTACILKYNLNVAASKLSTLINRNIQITNIPDDIVQREIILAFTITPFVCSTLNDPEAGLLGAETDDEEDEHQVLPDAQSPRSPAPKKRRLHGCLCDDDDQLKLNAEDEPAPEIELILNTINGNGVSDCVIGQDEFIEPPAQEIIELHRTAGRPLSTNTHKYLDLLAFPHLFPHGVNGLNQEREIKITPPDYYQQRLMSADKRFSGNIHISIYATAQNDKVCLIFR